MSSFTPPLIFLILSNVAFLGIVMVKFSLSVVKWTSLIHLTGLWISAVV